MARKRKVNKNLHIAVIAPPLTSIPPKGQGGTERIIDQTIKGLAKKSHQITLLGAGKYKGPARFIQLFKKTISERKIDPALCESSRPLRLEEAYIAKAIKEVIKKEKSFDVILNHVRGSYLFLPFSPFLKTPVINIFHLPLFSEIAEILSSYKKPNIVTISNSQRDNFKNISYLATIYNGVDLKEFSFNNRPKDYFVFMGAMGEHKNPKDAIMSAKKAKISLVLAGGKKREPYFSKEIKPLIDRKRVKYVGEASGEKRINLLKYAKALLFPIKWEEPFGLVMIEAMACGTPVIAYDKGAVREIIKDKETGFIIKNVKQMVAAIKKVEKIDRKKCRKHIEKNFSVEKMVDKYEALCYRVLR